MRECTGPSAAYTVTVPDGASEGEEMPILLPSGERLCVRVPSGIRPGETFDVSSPVDMVL